MVNLAVGFHEAAFTGCGYEVDHFFARTPWSMFPQTDDPVGRTTSWFG
jgi:hypothetical protein